MKKQDAFCEHNVHVNIICLQCAAKRKAENEEKVSREKAIKRIQERVDKLDW